MEQKKSFDSMNEADKLNTTMYNLVKDIRVLNELLKKLIEIDDKILKIQEKEMLKNEI